MSQDLMTKLVTPPDDGLCESWLSYQEADKCKLRKKKKQTARTKLKRASACDEEDEVQDQDVRDSDDRSVYASGDHA